MDTIIENVFLLRIVEFVIMICIIIAILWFIRWALKDDVHFKRIFAISIIISVVIVAILGASLSGMFLDIRNEDYVTYRGKYIERGGGQRELKTVVVYDERGNEIRLLRTGSSKKGIYEGTVIYGKRSKIVVEYNGILKAD